MALESRIHFLAEKDFWRIIDDSIHRKNTHESQKDALLKGISSLTLKQMIGFDYFFRKFFREAYQAELWACAHTACWGCGDSMFEDFRCWVISRGEKVYYNSLKNPDSLIEEFKKLEESGEEPFYGKFFSIVTTPYEEKTGKLIGEDLKYYEDDLKKEWEYEVDVSWIEDEERLLKVCPLTLERYRDKSLLKSWNK